MADAPRHQLPYPNMTPVPNFTGKAEMNGRKVAPKSKKGSNVKQAQLAMQGLVGAK